MSALAEQQHTEITENPPVQIPETAAIMQMIERVAVNPNADMDKLERCRQLSRQMGVRARMNSWRSSAGRT